MPKGYAHLRSVTRTAGAPVSNLENLRKQAKQYVRWHPRRLLPRGRADPGNAAPLSPPGRREVLEQPFKLSDAQELVARQSGFENWPALKAGVQAMPTTSQPPIPPHRAGTLEASSFVADLTGGMRVSTSRMLLHVKFCDEELGLEGAPARMGGIGVVMSSAWLALLP